MLGPVIGVLLSSAVVPASVEQPDVNSLLVVDCLLPGQVRSLGQRTVYLSARRPARLPARECRIRGGEYVASDRATMQSALAVWLPAAREGDAEAAATVGEIFERGIGGGQPDYPAAMQWYRTAADRGSLRAQINLGHMYEKGLGVAVDPAQAALWYRRAAGIDMPLDGGTLSNAPAASDAALKAAEQQLAVLTAQLSQKNRELEDAEARLRTLGSELNQREEALAAQERETATRSQSATDRQREADRLLGEAKAEADQLRDALEHERAALARQLDTLKQQGRDREAQQRAAAEGEARLAKLQDKLTEREAEYARQQAQTEQQLREEAQRRVVIERDLAESRDETQKLRDTLAREQAALAKRRSEQDAEASRRDSETRALREEISALQGRLAAAQRAAEEAARQPKPSLPAADMAGPSLAIIDPEVLATRGVVLVAASSVRTRQIVGRVQAPAGLLTLSVNDVAITPNDLGVFTHALELASDETSVKVVAIDRQGKRATLDFSLRGPSASRAATSGARATDAASEMRGLRFGNYHALVIGNNAYRFMQPLKSAATDARDVAEMLEKRFGFKVTLLLDADRYAILSALNTLREKLTSEDNLLVYYAGHGELDEVNSRGHWLPIDAERNSTANWIPTTAITDLLNAMQARKVLLVVDSCYSGALTRSSVGRLETGLTGEERRHWVKTMLDKRTRTVLTSGGLEPVLDAGGGRNSVFAKAFLQVLRDAPDVLDGQTLHREISARVAFAAADIGFNQVPEYAPIRFAGHESGEFFLVPKS